MINKKYYLEVGGIAAIAMLVFVPMASAGTTPPPFDLVAGVKDVQMKVNWILGNITTGISSQLTVMQNTLTGWFGPTGEYHNVAKIESDSGRLDVENGSIVLEVNKSKPFKLTITVATEFLDGAEDFYVWYRTGPTGGGGFADAFIFTAAEDFKAYTFECVTNKFMMYSRTPGDGFTVFYQYVIEYSD